MSALRLSALALSALLCACAVQEPAPSAPPESLPPLSEAERWERHLQTLASVNDWTAQGKVGYRLPDDAGSASLRWEQAGPDSEVRLSGPLGAGATLIRNAGALLQVTRDGIARLYPADAAPWVGAGRLLPVPVSSLHHWLLGRPDPGQPVQGLETRDGLATALTQEGWEIRYQEYAAQGDRRLPRRLELAAPGQDIQLRLILRSWDLGPDRP
jgi:outer membrane lipoprotein LolB